MRFPIDSADAAELADQERDDGAPVEPGGFDALQVRVAREVLGANPGDPQLRLDQLEHRLEVDPLGATALAEARRSLRKPTDLAAHTAAVQLLADHDWRAEHAVALPAGADA